MASPHTGSVTELRLPELEPLPAQHAVEALDRQLTFEHDR
jgi:hypothetical protein